MDFIKQYFDHPFDTELIVETSFSKVFKINQNKKTYFIKLPHLLFSKEAYIIQYLNNLFPDNIPPILNVSLDNHTFITLGTGVNLDLIIKTNKEKINLIIQAIKIYQNIQFKADNRTLLNLGVRSFPTKDIHLIRSPFLDFHNINYQKVKTDCELLTYQYHLSDVLEHGDFHVGNILWKEETNKIYFIDWGEANITNPFFSLIRYEQSLYYKLNLAQEIVNKVHQTYCKNYAELYKIDLEKVELIYKISQKLYPIYEIWCLETVLQTNPEELHKQRIQKKIQYHCETLSSHYH